MEKTNNDLTFWQSLNRFFGYIRYLDYNAVVYFICEIYDALQPILIIQITTSIISTIENSDISQLCFFVKIFVLLIVGQYITGRLGEIAYDRAFNNMECKLLTKYMNEYIAMDQTTTEKYGTGKLNNIFTGATNAISSIILETGLVVVVEVIGLIYAIFLLATKSPTIYHFFGMFLVVVMGVFFLAKGLAMIQEARRQNKEISMEIDRLRTKIIMSKMEILQNDKIDRENSKFKILFDRSSEIRTRANTKKHIRQLGTSLLFDGVRVLIYIFVGLAVIRGEYQIAYLLLLLELLRLSDKYIRNIRKYFRNIYKESINISKLWEILDNTLSIDYKKGSDFVYRKGDIQIHNLSFSYQSEPQMDTDKKDNTDKNKEALHIVPDVSSSKGACSLVQKKVCESKNDKNYIFHNFNLQIQGGTKTAFVGESGGGKSTLIKLLAGYIRPDSGEIEIDGQCLVDNEEGIVNNLKKNKKETISLQSYYKHIGYLTQEPSVFDGTIWENLVYGLDNSGELTRELQKIENKEYLKNLGKSVQSARKNSLESSELSSEILRVIKLAKCEFVYDFEKGLETEIGERGVRLSGGQKQRLAIAKIMLKNPNIILLDEPTSALDSFNEELVSQALHNLFNNRTVVIVAHRLQTVKNADIIHYIAREEISTSKGSGPLVQIARVVESGTHKELIAKNGKYKRMLDLQSGF